MATMLRKSAVPTSSARPVAVKSRKAVVCRAQQNNNWAQKLASGAAAAMLTLGSLSGAAVAGEFDVLAAPRPTSSHLLDDAEVLSRATRSEVNSRLTNLEIASGYRVDVVTVRKLEFETDAFAFSDKVLENWYGSPEGADSKGVVLVVTAAKEGAVVGGPTFIGAASEELLDSIVSDNIPIFTEQEKYNQAVISIVDRLEAKLNGKEVPAAPVRNEVVRQRTYKTKEETEKSKSVTSTVVATLLIIAFVVPMLQYYGYTARD